jgi:hypothetical protein
MNKFSTTYLCSVDSVHTESTTRDFLPSAVWDRQLPVAVWVTTCNVSFNVYSIIFNVNETWLWSRIFLLLRTNEIIFIRNLFNFNFKVHVKEICQIADKERSTHIYSMFIRGDCVNIHQDWKILLTSQYFLSSSCNRTEFWNTRIVWHIMITAYLNKKEENVTEINYTAWTNLNELQGIWCSTFFCKPSRYLQSCWQNC